MKGNIYTSYRHTRTKYKTKTDTYLSMLNNTDVRIPNILTVSSWLQLPSEITVVINTTFIIKTLIHQWELRKCTKVVLSKQKSSFHFVEF